MRKIALMAGVAGLMLAAPAFAQDGMTPPASQTPPQPAPMTPPSTPTPSMTPPATPQTASVQPGASVRGSDGEELGKLEGARQGAAGQELLVRGADGQLRAVPTTGASQQDGAVVTAWSTQEFQAAPAVEADAETTATPPAEDDDMSPPPSSPSADPSTQPQPADPAATPAGDQPPAPGEGESPPTAPAEEPDA